jgi:hypothetical protein
MNNDIKNKGMSARRYERDPEFRSDELAAAKVWDRHAHQMEYVLSSVPNERSIGITDRDRLIAATVIQWLGSPVGVCCLDELYEEVHAAKTDAAISNRDKR